MIQRFNAAITPQAANTSPLVLLFERTDAIAVPLLSQLRMEGYDVRAARIPVEVFDIMQREPVELLLIDLGNAAANRREFWVGLDSPRRNRSIHIITFRYMSTGETGALEEGLRVARADVEIQSANNFNPLIEAVRARLPGATPSGRYMDGPPANLSLPPAPPSQPVMPPSGWNPMGAQSVGSPPAPNGETSPFDQPYSENPFKRNSATRSGFGAGSIFAPSQGGTSSFPSVNPGQRRSNSRPFNTPQPRSTPPSMGSKAVDAYASAFGPQAAPSRSEPATPSQPSSTSQPSRTSESDFDDAWTPPTPRRGIAYRGYDDTPLAPDDPRIEDSTAPVPIVHYAQATGNGQGETIRNDRALSTILMDSAVIAPQRLDALRSIQQTLSQVGMEFSISELAMLFRFLTPDQLLAALLVSRGAVTAEEIASLGRIKQELQATGKNYDLESLLIKFNILSADEVRQYREELAM
jgi:hypothetical protein